MPAKYPDIHVRLTGQNGNAMVLIGCVTRALNQAGVGTEVNEFVKEAMSGDYAHVITTATEWVDVS
jgi:hypothetical protein